MKHKSESFLLWALNLTSFSPHLLMLVLATSHFAHPITRTLGDLSYPFALTSSYLSLPSNIIQPPPTIVTYVCLKGKGLMVDELTPTTIVECSNQPKIIATITCTTIFLFIVGLSIQNNVSTILWCHGMVAYYTITSF